MDKRSSLGLSIRLVYIFIYLLPLAGSILCLLFEFRDRETRLHALMCLYIQLAVILAHLILGLFAAIPWIGVLFTIIIVIMYILYAFTMLMGLVRALQDSILKVPFFYDLAYRGSF